MNSLLRIDYDKGHEINKSIVRLTLLADPSSHWISIRRYHHFPGDPSPESPIIHYSPIPIPFNTAKQAALESVVKAAHQLLLSNK